ncbi:DUF2059 domain-containing protein [Lysobacter sp. cf310]|uniref:DUF2059 domain-containing protein n=1 Tax=Lysobacter sp. cf310 TaxID=1761790 RepID=UPI0008F3538F|nr:DUF2059 domain-containing protein [Lysobacter sp. cf310]SFL14602.1 hypothetical protein SAMN04487938_3455 [Lysobacter sp. cf310]
MKSYALALALMLASPLAALAAPPSDAQVSRLLEVMRARQTVETMLPQIEASQQQMVEQMMAGREITPAERERLNSVIARSSAQMRKSLAWDKLEPIYRDIYRDTFDGQDTDALIAFYASPTGQRLLDKMPALMQNTMSAMQKLVVPMMQELQKDIEAEARNDAVKRKSAGAETK